MAHSEQHPGSGIARLVGMAGLLMLLLTAIAAPAQTFQVIHNFTGGADGGDPLGRLTIDGGGRLRHHLQRGKLLGWGPWRCGIQGDAGGARVGYLLPSTLSLSIVTAMIPPPEFCLAPMGFSTAQPVTEVLFSR